MRTPDFLVVGAARAGTTSLHSYLRQHPDIFLPGIKEPCFFVFEGGGEKFIRGKFAFAVRDFASYEKLFEKAGVNQRIGEMSTPYLYLYDKTIASIRSHFPDYQKIKIIILLRQPADRAFSQYLWRVRDGREALTFEEAIDTEAERRKENFSFDYYYVHRGFYFAQVKAYLENFKNVHICFYEDFKKAPDSELKKICSFLDVRDDFHFHTEAVHNEAFVPKWGLLSKLVTAESRMKFRLWYSLPDTLRKKIRRNFSRWNTQKNVKIRLNRATRNRLNGLYRDDIEKLQELIKKDLSSWLENE